MLPAIRERFTLRVQKKDRLKDFLNGMRPDVEAVKQRALIGKDARHILCSVEGMKGILMRS